MARNFSRQEFYDLVWSKPMTQLAKEFVISDVALHKICRKHGIPNPPLGWWAKKAAGKKVTQTPLPKAKAGSAERITIANADLSGEAAALASVREQARILASEGDDLKGENHPVVDRTIAALRKAKPSEIGIVTTGGDGFIICSVAVASIERLALALPRIVRAASLQGFRFEADEQPAWFKSETETVGFSITETIRREKHVLTPKEQAEQDAWQRKRDRAVQRKAWGDSSFFGRPIFPEWDYRPTGQLSFELEDVWYQGRSSARRAFRDAKVQRLETMASDIAIGIAVLAAAKTDVRRKREAQQKKADEDRRRREQIARTDHIEKRRAAALSEILTEIDELDRFRRLVAVLKGQAAGSEASRVAEFLTWADGQLAEREGLLSASGLEDRFDEDRLFGDDDDHNFVPPQYYGPYD